MRKEIRIVTWNCAMALRQKLREVASLDADLLVLQECSRADVEELKSVGLELACWIGDNVHKGLALAARSKFQITAKPICGIQWAIQGITGRGSKLGIVAIWACAPDQEERYIRQVHKLLDLRILQKLPPRALVVGDFNSNTIWDGKHRERSHSRVVGKFSLAGYRSAYHDLYDEPQGQESISTFFLHRDPRKPYHIDYAFLSPQLRQDLIKVEIGRPEVWLRTSDHMPFSIEFDQR